jgi:VanZ family protein
LPSEELEDPRKGRTKQRLLRYGPLIAWMAAIFYASSGQFSAANTSRIIGPLLRWLFPRISDEQLAFAHFVIRKAAHFTEYAVLGWLAARAFTTSSRQDLRRQWFLAALLLVVVYALTDEYHQSFVQSRTASIYDSFIDMTGGLAALMICALRRRKREKPKPYG